MKTRREDEVKRPVEEFAAYEAALAKQSKIGEKTVALQARYLELNGQFEALQNQLVDARNQKAAAIEKLALNLITRGDYDAVKLRISGLLEEIEETAEQLAIIDRTLTGSAAEIRSADSMVLGARYTVLGAIIDREAAEIRELVGSKILRLACLTAQLNVPDYGQQLIRIFPAPAFDTRIQETKAAMNSIFGE